jgi:exonuclease SbcC
LERLSVTQEATCPLCGQPLDEQHRTDLIAQLTTEREQKREQYRLNQTRLKDITAEIKELKAGIEEMSLQLGELPALRERAGSLQTRLDRANEAQARLDEERAGLQAVMDVLEQESFAGDIREQLRMLSEQREALGYDRNTHDMTRQQLDEYRQYEAQNTRLQVAEQALPAEKLALDGSRTRQQRINEALDTERAELEALESEITQLEVLVEEEQKRRQEVSRLRTAATVAHERLVTAQQQLKALEDQRKRKAELQERQSARRHDEAIYKELRTAFGKNGVPAMIIETAIPELEAEANDLLARMSDGRMTLRLTTQREKLTGGVAETLDIEIADELGTRNYEMYSGGEAFRIDFAIRVALSKMLARRAGAHLRTLFIDEGFGSQDDDGRSKLVEAITAIQSDFDLILVITHIDELRDSFPVHVLVDKTPNGSMIRVR